MPDILNLGPFLIKTAWLALVIGGIIGYWIMKVILKQTPFDEKKILDIFFNSAVIILLTWKFGPLIVHPGVLLQNPFNILVASGTVTYIWVGYLLAAVYLVWKVKKNDLPFRVFFYTFPFGFLGLWICYHLLIPQFGLPTSLPWGVSIQDPTFQYHPINWYEAIAGFGILMWLWRNKLDLGSGKLFSHFLILFGACQMLVSFFSPQTAYFVGISLPQLGYIIMIILGFLWPIKAKGSEET